VRVGKSGHPRPWRTIKNESGIVIKDAAGTTVSQMAYSGQGVGAAEAQARSRGPHHLGRERARLARQADVEATLTHHIGS
jgi:hypothetical protein